jgi:putative nucleotidyltransferase with HDIG domain
MAIQPVQTRKHWAINRTAVKIFFLVLTSVLSLASLVLPVALRPASFPLKAGDVASQDIQAPKGLTYESNLLTEQARRTAENMVVPVYLPVDASISRRQIEKLRVALNYISTVRADEFAIQQQKMSDLAALSDLHLTTDTANQIVFLNETRWQVVQQEAINVLEQDMRNSIREDHLSDARRDIPTLISFTLPQDQASIITEVVTPFVVPNSLYSAEQTDAAKVAARKAIVPVSRAFISGEMIVLRGQVITPTDWEALQSFGLIQPQNHNTDIIAAGILVLLMGGFVNIYFYRRRVPPMDDLKGLGLICLFFLVYLVGARFLIPNRTVLPYLYPLPAFGLAIAALYNMEIGLILSLVLSILASYGLPNSLDLTLFYIMTSFLGVLALGKARRISSFFSAGIAIGIAGMVVILAYRLNDSLTDLIGIATLIGASLFNGIASASLTLLFQFLFAQVLGLTTSLQLLELSRPDHPLMQLILRNAPGTYQHSLQVANLAEQAAENIGADGLLTRVGAIYHDSGKAMNPLFFVENQVPGKINSHDDLDPAISAATIIEHVEDGVLLGKKYRLPPRLLDFMREHHGTLLTRYQYSKAVEISGSPDLVNPDLFRYPGPRPRSRETALLMLADGVEARARAELPKDEEELRLLIKSVFSYYEKEDQLDDTHLTLRDLHLAADSFSRTLRNTYHARIKYPEIKTSPARPGLIIETPQPLPSPLPETKDPL